MWSKCVSKSSTFYCFLTQNYLHLILIFEMQKKPMCTFLLGLTFDCIEWSCDLVVTTL